MSDPNKPPTGKSPAPVLDEEECHPPADGVDVDEKKGAQQDDDTDGVVLDDKPRSILYSIARQLTRGQDLQRVLIPTFFLEPRSILEKFTDLMAHPQLIIDVASVEDPVERMLSVLRWYMSGWYIRPKYPKKPYNAILGEMFFAYWDHGDSRTNYYAEQVSHHPPVSALYVENRKKNFIIEADIYMKSKFLGNSAAAITVGNVYLNLLNRDEEYVLTMPTTYACGLFFGRLRMEYGEHKSIVCKKTGLTTEVEFMTKGMFGSGDLNRVRGRVFRNINKDGKDQQEVLYTFDGHWDTVVKITNAATGKEDTLFEVGKLPKMRKFVTPLDDQDAYESRKVWCAVADALKKNDHDTATSEKAKIEDAQRKRCADREAKGIEYQTRFFKKDKHNFHRFVDADRRPYVAGEPEKPPATDYLKVKLAEHRASTAAKVDESEAYPDESKKVDNKSENKSS